MRREGGKEGGGGEAMKRVRRRGRGWKEENWRGGRGEGKDGRKEGRREGGEGGEGTNNGKKRGES